jgi:hypothetical protein
LPHIPTLLFALFAYSHVAFHHGLIPGFTARAKTQPDCVSFLLLHTTASATYQYLSAGVQSAGNAKYGVTGDGPNAGFAPKVGILAITSLLNKLPACVQDMSRNWNLELASYTSTLSTTIGYSPNHLKCCRSTRT